MSDMLHEHPTEGERQPTSPFERERQVMMDDPAMWHDDISLAQTDARAAARLSGAHEESLLYQPGYIFDPRSGGEGALYYPSEGVSGVTQEGQSS